MSTTHRLIALLSTSVLCSSLAPIAHAESRTQIIRDCNIAYQKTVARLNRVPRVKVSTKKTWKIEGYKNFPYPGTYGLSIGISGAGVSGTVFKSPKFLTSVATDFLSNCKAVTLFKLGQAGSHLMVDFGIVNGRVEAFDCYDIPAGMRSYQVKSIPWGRSWCP